MKLQAYLLYVAPSGVCATLSTNQKTGQKEYSKHRQLVNPFECFLGFIIIVIPRIQVFSLRDPALTLNTLKIYLRNYLSLDMFTQFFH